MVNQIQGTKLLIDIGNSSLKWALSSANGLSEMSQQQYPETISTVFFEEQWRDLDKPSDIIVSCVASNDVWNALVNTCKDLWGFTISKITTLKEEGGLTVAYDEPSHLGSDRWCAMLGALDSSDSDFIVIDAGSALTIDVVNEFGKHLGGYIVPGINMMKQSLGMNTALVQLHGESDSLTSLSLGQTTRSCVESGILLSAVILIESVYKKQMQQIKNGQVYITGGDAELLASYFSFKCAIIPALVLHGLNVLADNKIKNN